MAASGNEATITIPEAGAIDLEVTLFGGQAFRWRREPNGAAIGWIGERPVRVAVGAAGLEVSPLDGEVEGLEAAARRYFDLSRDYAAIERRLFRDARLRRAASAVGGFRILRQPYFETLVAFIASANNNIVRFSRSLDALGRMAGEPVETSAGAMHAFPTPAALASLGVERLRSEANLGYRDRYVRDAAVLVASGEVDLDGLDLLPTPELRDALVAFPGVGRKVADCIALYGYGRAEVFPVDTWVRRAFTALYLEEGETATDRRIAELATKRFGADAGIAQQYMFEAFRRGLASL
jgi:N-glycosylase/DNA lyase